MAVAAMAQETDDPELESSLSRALQLRSAYLKGQADSLTLPAVRRLLERDLGFKPLHLDAHRALVKSLVDKVFNETEGKTVAKEKAKVKRKKISRVVEDLQDAERDISEADHGNENKKRNALEDVEADQEEETEMDVETSVSQGHSSKKPGKRNLGKSENQGSPLDKEGMENTEKPDSQGDVPEMPTKSDKEPSMAQGVDEKGPVNADEVISEKEGDDQEPLIRLTEDLSEQASVLLKDMKENHEKERPLEPSALNIDEDSVKAALLRRADELKSQAESLTVVSVRHLLEEDLGLGRDELNVHKRLIRRLIDELLRPAKEKRGTDPLEVEEAIQDQTQGGNEERAKAKAGVKSPVRKRRRQMEESSQSEEKPGANGEFSGSESVEERQVKVRKKKNPELKKKTVPAKKVVDVKRPFSANVERLREIMKAAGIGLSPVIYKKAKQAPEHERDEVLAKELENRLMQEGLSPNPTEKEIRKVKARLQKRKDLDGIESSNIVVEPRRSRAAANSWFTPRQNKYSQVENTEDKTAEASDSDDDTKPKVTGAMDD